MFRFEAKSIRVVTCLSAFTQMVLADVCFGQVGPGGGGVVPVAPAAGIAIDADGVVKPPFKRDKSRKLTEKKQQAYLKEHISTDVNKPGELRKVSLVRLEQECRKYLERGEVPPTDIQFLAGLNRIDYVFVYPEEKDLVIAGPAEGFAPDAEDRIVGVESGRPTLRLDDLVIALRTLQTTQRIGCSIDPEPENLAAMLRFNSQNSTATSVSTIRQRFVRMRSILGMHNVTVFGLPADSHYARTLVEADYRMKLISVGLEKPKVRGLPSHLALLKPQGNAMQRWWLTPLYDAFYQSEDGNAFEITGQRAQLMSQEEQVGQSGQRSDSAFTRVTTQKFSQLFTEKYEELAKQSPVFGELQNLIDLAIVVAMFKKERLPEKVDWEMSLFLDPQQMNYGRMDVPRKVDAVMNYRSSGSRLILGLIGGGVSILPQSTLQQTAFKVDAGRRLGSKRTDALPGEMPEKHPWWWD